MRRAARILKVAGLSRSRLRVISRSSASHGACLKVTAIGVGSGQDYACAILSNGTVACWGNSAEGNVGSGTTTYVTTPTTLSGLSRVTGIATRKSDVRGAFRGAGAVDSGIYLAGTSYVLSPAPVTGLSNVKAIAAGDTKPARC